MARGFGATSGGNTNDSVETAYNTTISGQRSYAIWYYQNDAGSPGNLQRLFEKRVSSGFQTELCILGSGIPGFQFEVDRSIQNGAWNVNSVPGTNQWVHCAVTYDASSTSNAPAVFFNGASASVGTLIAPNGSPTSNSDNFVIGNRKNDNARCFNGKLAWFCIWNGILLTQGEISALTQGELPFRIRPTSLVCCVPLWGFVSPEVDIAGHTTAVVVGTARQNDPPVNLFTRMPPQILAPSGTTVPWNTNYLNTISRKVEIIAA